MGLCREAGGLSMKVIFTTSEAAQAPVGRELTGEELAVMRKIHALTGRISIIAIGKVYVLHRWPKNTGLICIYLGLFLLFEAVQLLVASRF